LARLDHHLTTLVLNGSKVTDAEITCLADSKSLRSVSVYGTKVTRAGAKDLEDRVPRCRVETDGD
jgi:hypothetical protein